MKPTEAINDIKPTIALFVVLRDDGRYFAGFDPAAREALSTDWSSRPRCLQASTT